MKWLRHLMPHRQKDDPVVIASTLSVIHQTDLLTLATADLSREVDEMNKVLDEALKIVRKK